MTRKDAYDLFKKANELFEKLGTDPLEAVQYGEHGKGMRFSSEVQFNNTYDALQDHNSKRLEILLGKLVKVCTAIDSGTLRFKIKNSMRINNLAGVYFEDNLGGDTRFFTRTCVETDSEILNDGCMCVYDKLVNYFMKGGSWIFPRHDSDEPIVMPVITGHHFDKQPGASGRNFLSPERLVPSTFVLKGGYLVEAKSPEEAAEGINKFKTLLCGQFVTDAKHNPLRAVVEKLLYLGYEKAKISDTSASIDEVVLNLKALIDKEI